MNAPRDARLLFATRALRGFADGAVSVLLATDLVHIGLGSFEIGVLVTGTLLGSAALTLAIGLTSHRWRRRSVLAVAALLMLGTGLGFFALTSFVPLLAVAVVGTLNPSA